MLLTEMLYAKQLEAYIMPFWYSGADGGLRLRGGEEQVLTPSGSEENIDCHLLSCHQGNWEKLEATLHVQTPRNLAAG